MSWICSICGVNNANLNLQCVYCKKKNGIVTPRPALDSFDESEHDLIQCEIYKLSITLWKTGASMANMTPQEELFAKFFNHEKVLVKDMDDLTLRAHREDLQLIAKEARARLWAVDEEQQERSAKSKKVKGYTGSVEADNLSVEAINTINDRSKKMSKVEKQIENLMKLPGIDRATAERMLSATTIKAIQDRKSGEAPITVDTIRATEQSKLTVKASERKCPECGFSSFDAKVSGDTVCPECNSKVNIPVKKMDSFVNPFAKKPEPSKPVETTIAETAQAIIQQFGQPVTEEKPKPIVNPFAKG